MKLWRLILASTGSGTRRNINMGYNLVAVTADAPCTTTGSKHIKLFLRKHAHRVMQPSVGAAVMDAKIPAHRS